MAKLMIGADIVPTETNFSLFKNGKIEELIGIELKELFYKMDYILMNLEVPLTNFKSPILKSGPNLMAPIDTINGLKLINPYFYTLANNHIMDQGKEGLESTIKVLRENGIAFAGVGENISEASLPFIVNIKNIKLGIYCCAEHEFSIATKNRSGACPYDPLESFDIVRKLKKDCDKVVVLYHGGKEYYSYPSPHLQKVFHKFSDVGADYVIAQHTHCIGCMEKYNESYLVYGQGNFLFDYSNNEYWKTSLLLEIDLEKKNNCKFIPILKENNCVRLAKGDDKNQILKKFNERNLEILEEDFIENNYNLFAKKMKKEYFIVASGKIGKSLIGKIFNKLSNYKFIEWIYSSKYAITLENFIECEAHRELMIEILKNIGRKNNE